jgi:hypothetical protein
MRWCTCSIRNARPRVGLVDGNVVLAVEHIGRITA